MIEIVGAHRVRMQLEARKVGHPEQRRRIARHDFFRAPAGWKAERRPRRSTSGREFGRALLVEELAVDAVRIAHEHVGPVAGRAQRALGHRQVVARQIELGITRLREQHFPRVRDGDLPPVNRQDLAVACAAMILRLIRRPPQALNVRGLKNSRARGRLRVDRSCRASAGAVRIPTPRRPARCRARRGESLRGLRAAR